MAELAAASLPQLGERIAQLMLSHGIVLDFRGCGKSSGNFSLGGWVEDVKAAIDHLARELAIDDFWLCGFGTGGSVGLVAAQDLDSVKGVATVGSPADFDDWSADPDQLLAFAREVGVVQDAEFPGDLADWRKQLRQVKAIEAAGKFQPRPLLVMHGSEDKIVPHFDARLIADSHGSADLRFVSGGGHQLKHDPRAVAILLGWFAREQIVHAGDSLTS